MSPAKTEQTSPTHLFAWDGLAWRVPDNWDLSRYSFGKRVGHAEMEDDYSVRLEAEWTRSDKKLDIHKIQERYSRKSRKLTKAALKTRQIENLPSGWKAFLYTMPDGKSLLNAFVLAGESKTFCVFRIHFGPEDHEHPTKILKIITDSFRLHETGLIPWSAYDFSLKLPPDFRLFSTSLQAGRKLLTFHWRMHRLHIWHFSLAHILLKNQPIEKWATAFLNSFKEIKGPIFAVGPNGRIRAERRGRYRLGHFDEIGRWCFQYEVGCVYIKETDQITLWVYNYRQPQQSQRLLKILKEQGLA